MKSTLRNLITSKCPELLELKFGCEVKHPEFETKRILEIGKNYWRDKFDWEKAILLQDTKFANHCTSEYWDNPEESLKSRWYEILWTPPSWSDYLRCLGENYAIDGRGKILFNRKWEWVKWNIFNHVVIPYPKVDLAKSVLEQSDEILQKLVDLISNK